MHGADSDDKNKELLVDKDKNLSPIDQAKLKSVVFRAKIILFLIGLIHHLATVLIQVTSADLAKHFNKPQVISLFAGFFTSCQILVKIINAKYLVQIEHKKRFQFAIVALLLGITSIYMAATADALALSLLGSMLYGIGKALGDVVVQGFVKGFPPEIFGGYTTGQGFAGVIGATYYLSLKYTKFSVQTAFLIMIPIYVLFYFLFLSFIQTKLKYDEVYQAKKSQKTMEHEEAKSNKKMSWDNFKIVLAKSFKYNIVLALSYFFAYGITGFLLKRATSNMGGSDEFKKYAFELILLCLHCGILVSSSSLDLIKVKRVYLLMLLEGANFVSFCFYALVWQMSFYVLVPQVILSGILMGFIYVNSFYQLLNDKSIDKTEKEITLNLTILFKDLSIILSSGSGWVFNVAFK